MADLKISALTASTTPLAGTEVLPIVQSNTTKQVSVANLTAGRAVSASSFTAPTIGSATDLSLQSNGTTNATLDSYSRFGVGIVPSAWRVGAGTVVAIQIPGGSLWSYADSEISLGQNYYYGAGGVRYRLASGLISNYYQAGGEHTWYTSATGIAGSAVTNIQIWKMDSTGNLLPAVAAKGINFTANTPTTGSTSQLLNWYEEGTWTPSLNFGGANTGWAFYGNGGIYGKYTRIGNLVTVTGGIGILTVGSAAGAATITGLPFTSLTNGVTLGGGMNVTPLLLAVAATFNVSSNTTTMVLQDGAGAALSNVNFGAYTELHFSFSYQV